MAKKGDNKLFLVSLGIVAILVVMFKMISSEPTTEEAREKIEKHLYEKYGEEFVVNRIGTRKYKDEEEFVARIHPKSIVGTPKEGDKYYYGSASVDILPFGRLDTPGDSYSYVKMNMGGEKYISKKVKEIFGERTLIKLDSELMMRDTEPLMRETFSNQYKVQNIFFGYKEHDFKKALNIIKEDSKNNRIELELYLYIFDRIDDDKEKEKRRKDIFEFIQYLKKEGLFEYLEMGVIFIDERVLAPSYNHYKWEVEDSVKVKKEVEGEKVYLPPMELRKEMSRVLGDELEEMSEEELMESMNGIQKSDLSYEGIRKYHSHYFGWIYSKGMLKANYNTSYQKYKKNNKLENYNYNEISNIDIGQSLEYIYIN